MFLSLEAAAKHANVTVEDVFSYISSGKLKAKAATEAGVVNYTVAMEDLENFLAGSSEMVDSDFEDDFLSESFDKKAKSSNIRRLLTAEAVSDLRVQTQVLASRIDTLERLFSEFIELEKTESTLVLENSWKLSPEGNINQNQVFKANVSYSNEQPIGVDEEKETAPKRDKKIDQESAEILSSREVGDAVAVESDKVVSDLDVSISPDEKQFESRNLKIEENIQQKEKAADSVRAKLLKKNQLATEIKNSDEIVGGEIKSDEQLQEAESVTDRLAQYEIKLAKAKQAANQLWH